VRKFHSLIPKISQTQRLNLNLDYDVNEKPILLAKRANQQIVQGLGIWSSVKRDQARVSFVRRKQTKQ